MNATLDTVESRIAEEIKDNVLGYESQLIENFLVFTDDTETAYYSVNGSIQRQGMDERLIIDSIDVLGILPGFLQIKIPNRREIEKAFAIL